MTTPIRDVNRDLDVGVASSAQYNEQLFGMAARLRSLAIPALAAGAALTLISGAASGATGGVEGVTAAEARLNEVTFQVGASIKEAYTEILASALPVIEKAADLFLLADEATGGWSTRILTLIAGVGALQLALRALGTSGLTALIPGLGGGRAGGRGTPGAVAATGGGRGGIRGGRAGAFVLPGLIAGGASVAALASNVPGPGPSQTFAAERDAELLAAAEAQVQAAFAGQTSPTSAPFPVVSPQRRVERGQIPDVVDAFTPGIQNPPATINDNRIYNFYSYDDETLLRKFNEFNRQGFLGEGE